MKLATFRRRGDGPDRVGAVCDDGRVIDLAGAGPSAQFGSMLGLIEAGPGALAAAQAYVQSAPSGSRHDAADLVFQAPLPRPPQMRDAMSFHQHIKQSALGRARANALASGDPGARAAYEEMAASYRLPDIYRRQPVYYKCNRFAVCGTGQDVHWPSYSRVMDFELELACVIATKGKSIAKSNAPAHIFGFTIFNDFSARDAQGVEMEGRLGPAKGKDFDGANALGPVIVTADEIGDPYALRMQARVNGETWCDASSSTMDWRFDDLIAHISQDETLYPGEIIGSGTVGGGCGLELGRFLQSGDVVELEIEKIGVLRNRVLGP